MAIPVEEAIAALSTFSLEVSQDLMPFLPHFLFWMVLGFFDAVCFAYFLVADPVEEAIAGLSAYSLEVSQHLMSFLVREPKCHVLFFMVLGFFDAVRFLLSL